MAVQIDKHIPMPRPTASRGGRVAQWPWEQMKPGDSFFAPGYVQTRAQRHANEPQISVVAGKSLFPGSKWATRLVTENGVRGVRVWRTA